MRAVGIQPVFMPIILSALWSGVYLVSEVVGGYDRGVQLLPQIPSPLREASAAALEWPRLRDYIAARTFSPLGRAWILALEPCADLRWIDEQQQRTAEMRRMLGGGGSFEFHANVRPYRDAREGRQRRAALEAMSILHQLNVVERVAAWRNLVDPPAGTARYHWPGIAGLSAPLLEHDFAPLLRLLRGKIEPDGSLSDDASPELRRIRRAMERQHRAIEESLRRSLRALSEGGSTQDELITVRGERFVIPVKAEFKRRVPGVIHGSSSSGQTVFVEPLETIEQNNELVRLLDEEQIGDFTAYLRRDDSCAWRECDGDPCWRVHSCGG